MSDPPDQAPSRPAAAEGSVLDEPGLWRSILKALPDGVSIVDPGGTILEVNDGLCRMTGFARHELVGTRPPYAFWPPEDHELRGAVFDRTRATSPEEVEGVFLRKSGERFPALIHPAKVVREDGATVCFVATVKDITQRTRIARELRRSEEWWRSIAENPYDYVCVLDRDYRYRYVNHTAPGIRMEDLIGKATPLDHTDVEYHAVTREAFEKAFTDGVPASFEAYSSAIERWVSCIVGPIVEDGRVTAVSLLSRDITEAKRTEEALRHTQRLETLGALAGGIAHDFNNLLVPILGNTQLALRQLEGAPHVARHLEDVVLAANRARELIGQILVFARRQPTEPRRPVCVADVVNEALRLFEPSLPPTIEVEAIFADDCPAVLGAHGQIHQAVTNVLTNAVQALASAGGRLVVAVERFAIDDAFATLYRMQRGPGVRVTIKDDGPGMTADVLERVFEPYFTTKPVGEGSGLGLSVVQAIVAKHGGTVLVRSRPRAGATFELFFPGDATAPPPTSVVPQSLPRGTTEPTRRVLVVDDEHAVLRLVSRALEAAGHIVIAEGSSLEALRRVKADPGAFDVLVTDQTMPRLTGIELAEAIHVVTPTLPVVLMTAYASLDTRMPPNVRVRLGKPLSVEDLARAIELAMSPGRVSPDAGAS